GHDHRTRSRGRPARRRAGASDLSNAPLRRYRAALVALVGVLALPYGFLGPKFILDDWFTVYFRTFEGVLWTAGHGQLAARPGAWLTFMVVFGFIGSH